MEFEFNPEKSASNKDKHGIDFIEAQLLWLDEKHQMAPVSTETEMRYVLTGKIADKHWTAIFTWRESRACVLSPSDGLGS